MRLMGDFHKQVNAAIVDPGFIVSVRKKLALDQREAAVIPSPRWHWSNYSKC